MQDCVTGLQHNETVFRKEAFFRVSGIERTGFDMTSPLAVYLGCRAKSGRPTAL